MEFWHFFAFDILTKTKKNIRAAINRHLSDLERDMDIMKYKELKSANDTLDGKLKQCEMWDF